MSDDIVARLRMIAAEFPRLNEIMDGEWASAADEIEQLREQLRLANIDNFNTTAEVEQLRDERDEARRRVCEDAIRNGRVYRRVGSDTVRCETSKEVAEMMGWDCYKENKENTND